MFNSEGITAFILTAIVPIIITVMGVIAMGRANSKMSKNMTLAGNLTIGAIIIGCAGLMVAFGGDLASRMFTSA